MTVDWERIGTIALTTAGMYLALMAATRIAGRRTLSELSAFDVLTTIGLGTILGSTAISPSISWLDGAAGATTLLSLQVAIGAARRRWPRLRRLLDFRPEPVVQAGDLRLRSGVLGAQLTPDEVRSQLRQQGFFTITDVEEAIFEPNGRLSVRETRRQRSVRSPRAVLEDHVRRCQAGDLEGDLAANYDPDVVLLAANGAHRGHDGLRALEAVLPRYLRPGPYDHHHLEVSEAFGLLTWSARRGGTVLYDGADSFVVRSGRIIAQVIHDGAGGSS